VSLKLSSDFAKKIAEAFNWSLAAVDSTFEFEEDREGYFWARLQPKKFLDKPEFQRLCRLTEELGGQGYLKGMKAWKVPGPCCKNAKSPETKEPAKPTESTQAKESTNVISESSLELLPVEDLLTMPFLRRKQVEGPDFEDLVESVKAVGVLEPILVRLRPDARYEVVAGDRRHAAAQKANLKRIPAVVKKLPDADAYEIRMIENVQRKDLSDMEKAEWLDFMIKQFGYTQETLGKKLGKSKAWVSLHLSMLELEKVYPGKLSVTGSLTERQARGILAAPPEKREEILDNINKTGQVPSSREMERQARGVPCAECGQLTSEPIHVAGKFYCSQECKENAEAKAASDSEERTAGPSSTAEEKKAVWIGEFTCPECNQAFFIDHLPDGRHKLRQVRQEEPD
jgi:ParB/RepB/Spo0J family partition protein